MYRITATIEKLAAQKPSANGYFFFADRDYARRH